MVENFLMSSTKAVKLSKTIPCQRRVRAIAARARARMLSGSSDGVVAMAFRHSLIARSRSPIASYARPSMKFASGFSAVRCCWMGIRGRSQQIDRSPRVGHLDQFLRQADSRADRRHVCRFDLFGGRSIEKDLPGSGARRMIVKAIALDLSHARQEYRIRRVLRIESAQKFERARRLMFVPEIQPVQLIVGFAAKQRALIARALHFA